LTHTVGCGLLLISGSLRDASTNTAALRTAQASAPTETRCLLYQELALLPHFNPDDDVDPLDPAVARLRALVHESDALLLSTPEYAGALPGSLKNLLEWLIGDDQPGSIYEKPVAWINTSPRGAAHAHQSLQIVLGYAHAMIVEAACAEIPVTSSSVGADGLISDPRTRERIRGVVEVLVANVCGDHRSAG
jgi:chromate reductase, NAD(P)H dehydrogenase (quinone)